ncbi:MAG: hypothetical protein AB1330_01590 [Bacillota bacterium]
MFVVCPPYNVTGKVEHECSELDVRLIELICELDYGYGGYESLGVYRCKKCGQLWMIWRQYDPGTGRDHIWFRPRRRGAQL